MFTRISIQVFNLLHKQTYLYNLLVEIQGAMEKMGDVSARPADDEICSSLHNDSSGKDFGQRTLKSLKNGLSRLWRRHRGNALITEYDPCYKVAYLGNVLTGWAKGKFCYKDILFH